MRIHDSARKHGVEPTDAIQAATWAIWIEDLDDDSPARQLRLGFDTPEQGRSFTWRSVQHDGDLLEGEASDLAAPDELATLATTVDASAPQRPRPS